MGKLRLESIGWGMSSIAADHDALEVCESTTRAREVWHGNKRKDGGVHIIPLPLESGVRIITSSYHHSTFAIITIIVDILTWGWHAKPRIERVLCAIMLRGFLLQHRERERGCN